MKKQNEKRHQYQSHINNLKQTKKNLLQLSSAPVPALGIVSDCVVRLEAEPVGDGTVLPLLLAQNALDLECLVGWLKGSIGWKSKLEV